MHIDWVGSFKATLGILHYKTKEHYIILNKGGGVE